MDRGGKRDKYIGNDYRSQLIELKGGPREGMRQENVSSSSAANIRANVQQDGECVLGESDSFAIEFAEIILQVSKKGSPTDFIGAG